MSADEGPLPKISERASNWFLAQLKPNGARIAERNLKRQGFETFLPLEKVTRRTRSKFVTTAQPVFPGYIFVAFDAQAGGWQAINATHGITRLVSFGAAPALVPQGLVSALMARCDEEEQLTMPAELAPGDAVVLPYGPLANFVATVDSIDPDRRVWVLLDIMGAQTRVAVAPDHLRAI